MSSKIISVSDMSMSINFYCSLFTGCSTALGDVITWTARERLRVTQGAQTQDTVSVYVHHHNQFVSLYVLDAIFRYGFRWFSWQEKHTKSDILRPRIFMYEKIYLPPHVNWTWPSADQNPEVKSIPWDHNFVDLLAYCRLLYQQCTE